MFRALLGTLNRRCCLGTHVRSTSVVACHSRAAGDLLQAGSELLSLWAQESVARLGETASEASDTENDVLVTDVGTRVSLNKMSTMLFRPGRNVTNKARGSEKDDLTQAGKLEDVLLGS